MYTATPNQSFIIFMIFFTFNIAKVRKDIRWYIRKAYLEPRRTSTLELFCRNSQRVLAINCFNKKSTSHIFELVQRCKGFTGSKRFCCNVDNRQHDEDFFITCQKIRRFHS